MIANIVRHFAEWLRECEEGDDFLGTPRFLACTMVLKEELETILDGPSIEEFNAYRAGFLMQTSLNKEEASSLWVCHT
jgi:hypothetical protein